MIADEDVKWASEVYLVHLLVYVLLYCLGMVNIRLYICIIGYFYAIMCNEFTFYYLH